MKHYILDGWIYSEKDVPMNKNAVEVSDVAPICIPCGNAIRTNKPTGHAVTSNVRICVRCGKETDTVPVRHFLK